MRAVIYARFSSLMQREESIDAQIRACDEYIKNQKGWMKTGEYIDRAVSARSDQRPEFQHMIEDAKLGKFDVIVIHKLDRFSRDRYDHSHYKRILKQAGVKLVSVTERLDDTPEGVVLESVLEGFSEYYSRNLARETKKGQRETALQRKHTGGVPPLGYDVDSNGYYIVNKHEAEAVRYIFEAYLRGDGYGSIVRYLDKHNYKSKRGKSIPTNSLYDILRNEKYTGTYIFNRSASKDAFGRRNTHKNKSDDEIIRIEDGMPAIIDRKMYKEVLKKMENNRHGAHKAIEPYLLSGLLYCGKCGGSYTGSTRGQKDPRKYYECNVKKRTKKCDMLAVRRDDIENMVIEYLESISEKENIDRITKWILDNTKTYRKKAENEMVRTKKQLDKATKEANKLLDKILDGLDSPAARERLSAVENEKLQLEIRMSELYDITANTETVNKKNLTGFLSQLKDLSKKERKAQKQIIHQFMESVTVYPKDGDEDRPITMKTRLDQILFTPRIETVASSLHQ